MRNGDRPMFWALGVLFVLLIVAFLQAQSATYPAGVVSFTTKTAGQTIQSAHVNTIQAEITAIENALLNGLAHVVKPLTDATYDLGTGAFRWRDAFFSRNVTIGGTLGVTGTLTAPALVGGWTTVTSTATGTLNDFAPGLVGNTVVRMNNATLATITGFAGGADGQLVDVESIGAGRVDTAYATSAAGLGSVAANRLLNWATTGNTSAAAGVGMFRYRYDGATARWRLVRHEQGTWLTPTFAAGNFTGLSAMTWTVDAGDVGDFKYYVHAREVSVTWNLATTTVAGTPSAILQIGNGAYGGFTAQTAPSHMSAHSYSDNLGTDTIGRCFVQTASIGLQKAGLGNWTAATDATSTFGSITFEIRD